MENLTPRDPRTPAALSGETTEDRVLRRWEEAHRLGRLTVEEAWLCGRDLAKLRDKLHNRRQGGFALWLEEHGLSRATAYRWIKLGALPVSQLETLTSVDEALKSLPPPPREPVNQGEAAHRSAERKTKREREQDEQASHLRNMEELAGHKAEGERTEQIADIADDDDREAEEERASERNHARAEQYLRELVKVRAERDEALGQARYWKEYASGLEKKLEASAG